MLNSMKEREEDRPIDAILMNGDFVAHGVSKFTLNVSPSQIADTWRNLKVALSENIKILRKSFPDTEIFPTIGNNDVIVHDNVPCSDDMAEMYYGELFDIWFPEDNSPKGFDRDEASRTFMNGGYYRHDFPQNSLTLLALNSINFKDDNQC